MKNINFPIFKSKLADVNQRFDLSDIVERKKYFELKAGPEIVKIKKFLKKNTFLLMHYGKFYNFLQKVMYVQFSF